MRSVLQDWVMKLGLRHQGVLLTAVRGCDTAPKNDPSKRLSRIYRAYILNAHCGDAGKAQTFMSLPKNFTELYEVMDGFRKNLDHYPHHFVMHMVHAAQIVGEFHPHDMVRSHWGAFYCRLCHSLHINPETREQLDTRLNADEETFGKRDRL